MEIRDIGNGAVEVTSASGVKSVWTTSDLPLIREMVRKFHRDLDRAFVRRLPTGDIASESWKWYTLQCALEGVDPWL